MSWRLRGTTLAAAMLMTACASVQQTTAPDGDTLSGRLAVRVEAGDNTPARSENAAFELQGNPVAGRLNLTTPLGSTVAQARWAPGSVVLSTPQGERRFADLDGLTREVLGESVPLAALFDWLRGRPWPGAPSAVGAASGGFAQLGWVVDLVRFEEGWVVARRERAPQVTVRARLDKP